jgi:hypothetical protein
MSGVFCPPLPTCIIFPHPTRHDAARTSLNRYLDAFPEDGGFWVGKNYTFDRRFNHGAKAGETIATCVYCDKPWDRYQVGLPGCTKCNTAAV